MSRVVRAASPSDKERWNDRPKVHATTGWRLAIIGKQSAHLAQHADGEVLTALGSPTTEDQRKCGTPHSPTNADRGWQTAGPVRDDPEMIICTRRRNATKSSRIRQQWDHLQKSLVFIGRPASESSRNQGGPLKTRMPCSWVGSPDPLHTRA